jgi:hypothetical protein
MASYELDLQINASSLQVLKAAGLNITIAKPVGGANPNVTWLVFDPFQGNTVTWDEDYGIYASPTPIVQNGAVITRLSETPFPAQDAAYYSFTSAALFSGPFTGSGSPGQGSYKVNNNMPSTSYPSLTFGLQQKASINGTGINPSPLNAAVVPAALSATFTPLTTVYVWLQANFQSGTVITEINGNAAIVQFGNGITKQSLAYNPATGMFVPTAGGQLMEYSLASGITAHNRVGIY